ncbi:MAG: DUF2184 domain-containing protein [Patescibacteria group bacterium]|nr:DUF2184 domain-containing protein [Patescibacteria group bacterium]
MANITPAFTVVNPSYTMPDTILPYSQASGAFETLAASEPLPRLSDGDLYAYIKRVDVRTRAAAGQSAYNNLPGVSTALSQISTPTYLLRVRAEYDHHDTAAYGRWGLSIVEAQRLGMRQAHFQLARTALLYGMNPANGEGLLNANGATATTLPPDTNGNTTVVTYDNGQMAFFLAAQVSAIKTRTNQLGIGRKFVFLGPQRTFGAMEYQNVVQLVQYQRPGAGSTSTAGVVKEILMSNGDTVIWAYDDTLIGKGANGTDAVIVIMPEVEKPYANEKINTNEFAKLAPGLDACSLMLCDMVAPREIPTPLPGGAIDVLSEWRITSGWGVRPEAIQIVSMQYQ